MLNSFSQNKQNSAAFSAQNESGFSLVEVIAAMVVLLVALLGVFTVFTYTINYNAGNNSRSQSLSVLQQETELLRSAKFTPFITDVDLMGGVKQPKIVASGDGTRLVVQTVVDDDPFLAGVQVDTTKTIKEITVTVGIENPTPGWQTAIPITTIVRRVRSN